MAYNFTLTTVIPATAREVYDAWLDSVIHSEMTGGKASISDELGAEISAWDGYITGRNLELVPGERIVQTWRTSHFADEHDDSIVTITLQDVADGTLLTLVHSNVPDAQTSYEQGGWQENYFEPMIAYFSEARAAAGSDAAPAAPPKASAERAATKPAARAKPKPKRVAAKPKAKAKTKAKRGALRAKAATKKPVRRATKKSAKKNALKRSVAKKKVAKKKVAKKNQSRKQRGRAPRRR